MSTRYEGRKMSRAERRQLQQNSFRWNQCERKKAFPSKAVAKRVRHFKHPDHYVEPYECPHCGKWHLGAPPKRSRRKAR
jgi:hypothetical protein